MPSLASVEQKCRMDKWCSELLFLGSPNEQKKKTAREGRDGEEIYQFFMRTALTMGPGGLNPPAEL
jgi:hypothetical protein